MRLRYEGGKILHDGFKNDLEVLAPQGLTMEAISELVMDANIGARIRELVPITSRRGAPDMEDYARFVREVVTVHNAEWIAHVGRKRKK